MKELLKEYSYVLVLSFGAALIVAALAIFFGFVNWGLRDINREGLQRSNQYIVTQVSALQDLNAEISDIDVQLTGEISADTRQALNAQRRAIINQMQSIANQVPDHEIPAHIQSTLSER